jgi:uncharacterized protein
MNVNPVLMISAAFLIAAAPAPKASSSAVPTNAVKEGVDAWSRGDYPTAVSVWRPAAIAGDADAQFNLGQAYKLGRGLPVDLAMAEDWYRKAAQQGHPQAQDNLGLIMFQNGKRQEALPILEKSAVRGEPRAQYIYGTTLFNGELLPKDWVRAYALMTRASAAGLGPASASLAQMDQFIPLDQRQKGLALARTMESEACKPAMPTTIAAPARPVSRPPQSTGPVARPVTVPPPAPTFIPAVAPPEIQEEERPVAPPAARRPVVTGKGWRVQLGAFGDASKARGLFNGLQSSIPILAQYQAQLVPAGAVTRLQAGPMASRGEAEQVCAAAKAKGQGCLVVAP